MKKFPTLLLCVAVAVFCSSCMDDGIRFDLIPGVWQSEYSRNAQGVWKPNGNLRLEMRDGGDCLHKSEVYHWKRTGDNIVIYTPDYKAAYIQLRLLSLSQDKAEADVRRGLKTDRVRFSITRHGLTAP